MTSPPYVRIWRNFVNLGNLYSVPPWGPVPTLALSHVQNNGVNLGDLYTNPKRRRPYGWAYFEDGSIFILRAGWLSHDKFEERMRIVARFLHDPWPRLKALQEQNAMEKRLILINDQGKELYSNTLNLLARSAEDGLSPAVQGLLYENVTMTLDSTRSYPVSTTFGKVTDLWSVHKLRNFDEPESFRGTLLDGILQPNVRLGNGIRLSTKPNEAARIATGRDQHARSRRQKLPGSSPRGTPGGAREDRAPSLAELRTGDDVDHEAPDVYARERDVYAKERHVHAKEQDVRAKERDVYAKERHVHAKEQDVRAKERDVHARERDLRQREKILQLEGRERDLRQREEILRWKRKVFLVEQKLARLTRGPSPTLATRDRTVSRRSSQSTGDIFPFLEEDKLSAGHASKGVGLDDFPPPRALETLRSRTQLPARKLRRSNRSSRQR